MIFPLKKCIFCVLLDKFVASSSFKSIEEEDELAQKENIKSRSNKDSQIKGSIFFELIKLFRLSLKKNQAKVRNISRISIVRQRNTTRKRNSKINKTYLDKTCIFVFKARKIKNNLNWVIRNL